MHVLVLDQWFEQIGIPELVHHFLIVASLVNDVSVSRPLVAHFPIMI